MMKNGDGEVTGYLVGSYKYDFLNDVLSLLILGNTGMVHDSGLNVIRISSGRRLTNGRKRSTVKEKTERMRFV